MQDSVYVAKEKATQQQTNAFRFGFGISKVWSNLILAISEPHGRYITRGNESCGIFVVWTVPYGGIEGVWKAVPEESRELWVFPSLMITECPQTCFDSR